MAETVKGLAELINKLDDAGKKLHTKWVRKALTAADKPIRNAAKANAMAIKDTGALARSIGAKRAVKTANFSAYSVVGPRRGVYGSKGGRDRVPANYGHLIEFGHVSRSGSFVAGRPILRPAWDANKAKALKIMGDVLWEGIKTELL